MYSIGEVSKMFGLPASTLRYYDKEGLFPNLSRRGNIREFSDTDLELLHVIECLKESGLEIRDIRHFVELVGQGPSTYAQRKELFQTRKAEVEAEIARLEQTRSMLAFKCWYYDKAIEDGDEEDLTRMIPDGLPAEIRALYDKGHEPRR